MIRGGRGDGGGAGTGGGGRGAGVGWWWCWEVIWKRFYEQATLMEASPGDRRAYQTPSGRFYRPQRTTATATMLLARPHGRKIKIKGRLKEKNKQEKKTERNFPPEF